ncbi:STAS domain-containing protein [Blastomonas sp. AAP53]|uniref:STAS domain-containing protein n=1 Tax=Blastomonas sp. AAP53 TaxID=1248760 RepID=UPI0003707605|nr:STAS domain-containing protein [Blastomonas sp. AAP53]
MTLPSRCDRPAAITFHPELRNYLLKGPVEIDGTDVSQLGQAMLQLLLSARQTATRTGHSLTIIMSEKMRTTLAGAGADPDTLSGIGMPS